MRPGSRSKQTRAVNAYFDHMASNTKMKAGTACTVTQSKAVILLDASISVIILIKILSKSLDCW